jgi:hypothetical protein
VPYPEPPDPICVVNSTAVPFETGRFAVTCIFPGSSIPVPSSTYKLSYQTVIIGLEVNAEKFALAYIPNSTAPVVTAESVPSTFVDVISRDPLRKTFAVQLLDEVMTYDKVIRYHVSAERPVVPDLAVHALP